VKGQSFRETIAFLIEGIYRGRYFIRPGPACDYCDVYHVCRKDHLPTAWRTANDPLTMPHFELARKDLPKSDEDD
jgi:ATP-dependent helicase/nuclease subunit B